MADATLTADLAELRGGPSTEAPSTSHLRTVGYCEECGTWDAHGLKCVSCGHDFSAAASETP